MNVLNSRIQKLYSRDFTDSGLESIFNVLFPRNDEHFLPWLKPGPDMVSLVLIETLNFGRDRLLHLHF